MPESEEIRELERQVERGNLFAHAALSEQATRSNEIEVFRDEAFYTSVSANAPSVAYRRIVFALNLGSNATHKYRFLNLGTQGTDRIDNDAMVLLVQQ